MNVDAFRSAARSASASRITSSRYGVGSKIGLDKPTDADEPAPGWLADRLARELASLVPVAVGAKAVVAAATAVGAVAHGLGDVDGQLAAVGFFAVEGADGGLGGFGSGELNKAKAPGAAGVAVGGYFGGNNFAERGKEFGERCVVDAEGQ